jgi:hypothetical protein
VIEASMQILSDLTQLSDRPVEPDFFDELLKCLTELRAQTAERRRTLELARSNGCAPPSVHTNG